MLRFFTVFTLAILAAGAIPQLVRAQDSELSAVIKLSRDLLALKSDEERAKLLDANREVPLKEVFGSLLEESERLRIKADYAEALEAVSVASLVAQRTGDRGQTADVLYQRGKILYYQSQYSQALEPLKQSLAIRTELADVTGQAQTLRLIGNAHRQQSDLAGARDAYSRSLSLSRSNHDNKETAATLNSMCLLDQGEEKYSQAEADCSESLALRRELGDKASLAESLLATGALQYFREQFDDALNSYNESLALYQELGSLYYVAYLNTSLGNLYFVQDDYVRAVPFFQNSIKIAEAIGDQATVASALQTIGEIHSEQGNFAVALEYLKRALALFTSLKIGPLYIARVQTQIGIVYHREGHLKEAQEWIEQAQKTSRDANSARDIAFDSDILGLLAMEMGDDQKASSWFTTALEQSQTGGLKHIQSMAQKNLANVALKQKRYDEAVQLSKRAADLAVDLGIEETLWQALEIEGQACAGAGHAAEAQKAFEQSIAVLEKIRGNVAGGDEDRQRYLAMRMEPYHALIGLLLANQNETEAFRYAERAKARVLFETLRSRRTDPEQYLTPEERDEERRQAEEMATLNLRILNENRKAAPDTKLLSQWNERLQKVRSLHEASLTAVYAAHPELRLQHAEIPSVDWKSAAAMLPDSGAALLEYSVAQDKTYLFLLTRSAGGEPEFQSFPIAVTQKDLAASVEKFRGKLADLDLGFSDSSKALYRLLIGPAEPFIAGKQNLLISPDAELWNLPFAALMSAKSRYLLQDHALLSVPSMAVFQEMSKAEAGRLRTGKPTLLAMGNPIPAQSSIASVKSLFRGAGLGPLPEAEEEVKALAAVYGPSQSKVYTGKEAREDRFKSEAPGYRILHIASHGILNDTSPLYSQLVLAPGVSPGSEDGLLEAWEIMRLKLNADLVVLSACETGRGGIGSGEGVIGLSWALMLAGVPTSVVSQWKVESKSTTELMVHFHQNLAQANPGSDFRAAAALRQAALGFMKDPLYRHPFYWAGFIVLGSGAMNSAR